MRIFVYPETSNTDFSFLLGFFFSKKLITSVFSLLTNFFFSKKLFLTFHVSQNKLFSSRNFDHKIKFLKHDFSHLETLIHKPDFSQSQNFLQKRFWITIKKIHASRESFYSYFNGCPHFGQY